MRRPECATAVSAVLAARMPEHRMASHLAVLRKPRALRNFRSSRAVTEGMRLIPALPP